MFERPGAKKETESAKKEFGKRPPEKIPGKDGKTLEQLIEERDALLRASRPSQQEGRHPEDQKKLDVLNEQIRSRKEELGLSLAD